MNPIMNVMLPEIQDNPERLSAAPSYNSAVEKEINESTKEFVEPYLPNYRIGIMHLAAGIWKDGRDMRLDNSIKIEIKSLENNTVVKSLRFEKIEKK